MQHAIYDTDGKARTPQAASASRASLINSARIESRANSPFFPEEKSYRPLLIGGEATYSCQKAYIKISQPPPAVFMPADYNKPLHID